MDPNLGLPRGHAFPGRDFFWARTSLSESLYVEGENLGVIRPYTRKVVSSLTVVLIHYIKEQSHQTIPMRIATSIGLQSLYLNRNPKTHRATLERHSKHSACLLSKV